MFNQIPEQTVEDVRNANDIVELIGEYVQLKKQGQNYFGLCPFHEERTPSFSVSSEKQLFHCFGCKKSGNIFTFLMEHEGYTFHEAVKTLADRSNVHISNFQTKQTYTLPKKSQNLLSAYEWATKFYHHVLKYTKEGEKGYQYLKQRGIVDENIEVFQIGFSPLDQELTIQFLQEKGFNHQLLTRAKIFNRSKNEQLTDPLAGRVIFPIRNHHGQVVAFSARAIFQQEPKYLNSAENELFTKSKILFNFDLARREIRKRNEVILFEGQLDVMMAYQAGIKNCVATLGTALAESQANLMRRYANEVIICYDGDHAGLEASYRAANLLRSVGCKVKISQLTEDLDPDEYIQRYGSKSFLDNIIKKSDSYIPFYMRYLKRDYQLNRQEDRITYLQKVLKQIATIDSSIEREHYLLDLSDQFQLSIETLKEEVNTFRKHRGFEKDKREDYRYTKDNAFFKKEQRLLPAYHNAERRLIAYMLKNKDITDKVQHRIGASFQIDEHSVIATHLYAYYEEYETANVHLFLERLADAKLKQLVIEMSMIPISDEISNGEIDDYIDVIQRQTEEMTLIQKYRKEQREAEKESDHIRAAQIAMQIIEIKKRLKNK